MFVQGDIITSETGIEFSLRTLTSLPSKAVSLFKTHSSVIILFVRPFKKILLVILLSPTLCSYFYCYTLL